MAIANQCGPCRIDFGSLEAFDTHRVGKHEYDYSEERPDGRRCLSEEEILESGKFEKNGQGRYSLARSLEHARTLKYGAQSA